MSATSTLVLVKCDICGDEMREQPDNSFICWKDSHRIPSDQLYRYAEHITIQNDFSSCDECGQHQETGFINDDGICMDCEEADSVNQV